MSGVAADDQTTKEPSSSCPYAASASPQPKDVQHKLLAASAAGIMSAVTMRAAKSEDEVLQAVQRLVKGRVSGDELSRRSFNRACSTA